MAEYIAYCLLGWWCCVQPILAFQCGLLIARHGGVRGTAHYLLDRIGVPRLE